MVGGIIPAVDRTRLRFLVRFALLIAVLYTMIALEPVDRTVIAPLTRGVTAAAAWLLEAGEEPIARSGTVLSTGGFAADVKNGCNGVEAMLLLIAAILAFPAPWKAKLAGLIAGVVLIQAVNLIRVVSLVILGRDYPHLFETFHVTVWQVVIFFLTIGMFAIWSSHVAQKPLAQRA